MGFPFEIITMLGSTLLSGVMSLWAESRKAKAEEQRLLITRGEFEMKAVKAARDNKSEGAFSGLVGLSHLQLFSQ